MDHPNALNTSCKLPSKVASFLCVTAFFLNACAQGEGQGFARGEVSIPACQLSGTRDLQLSHFLGNVIVDQGQKENNDTRLFAIRIQKGSFQEMDSDGISILVKDSAKLRREQLNTPIVLDGNRQGPVQMTLFLGETCRSGFPRNYYTQPVIMDAVSGTITFNEIYAPDVDPNNLLTRASFENVRFAPFEQTEPGQREPGQPDTFALISGSFSFVYQRGSPGQRVP